MHILRFYFVRQMQKKTVWNQTISLPSFLLLQSTEELEVRLIDGLYPSEGYLQTRLPNSSTWTTVCDVDWDLRDANVVCKQLGFSYAFEISAEGTLTSDLGNVIANNVYCNGDEDNFGECSLENNSECWSPDPAAVACTECKLLSLGVNPT